MSAFRSWPGRFGHIEKSFLVAVFCGFATTANFADEPKNAAPAKVPVPRVPLGNDWKIEIVPGPAIGPSPVPKAELAARQAAQSLADAKSAAAEPVIVPSGAESALPGGITSASYSEVYNSIPFRRSEYLANPSYRHDATIEILLGQIRPKTVVNVAPTATCCTPHPTSFWPVEYWPNANPWFGRNIYSRSFYYPYSHSRPVRF